MEVNHCFHVPNLSVFIDIFHSSCFKTLAILTFSENCDFLICIILFYSPYQAGKAVLNYEYLSSDLIELYHTEVPPAARGQGVATLLAEVS